MSKVQFKASLVKCEIQIKRGLFRRIGEIINKRFPQSHYVILTTRALEKIYGRELKKQLPSALFLALPDGEAAKNIKTALELAKELLIKKIEKRDVIIGFGGGVATDMAGFLASIYMRGVPFVAMPTTLLGMVDAAIGGKTGVDFKAKNMLGTFYPAELVLCDLDMLDSLPANEIKSGMAEVVKYAVTLDPSLFHDIAEKQLKFDVIVKKSIQAKLRILRHDPKETGARKILNYGHTFGHAIESQAGYTIPHGEAVSIGMTISNRIAQKLGKQAPETGEKIKGALENLGLPTSLPRGMCITDLKKWTAQDKKRVNGKIAFIIVRAIGNPEMVSLSPDELVKLAKT